MSRKGVFTTDETFRPARTLTNQNSPLRLLDGHGFEVVSVNLSTQECKRITAASVSADSARKAIAYLQGDGASYRGISAPVTKVEFVRAIIAKLPSSPITKDAPCPVALPTVEWKVQPSALWTHLVARMTAEPKAKAPARAKAPTASNARIEALEAQLATLIAALQGSVKP